MVCVRVPLIAGELFHAARNERDLCLVDSTVTRAVSASLTYDLIIDLQEQQALRLADGAVATEDVFFAVLELGVGELVAELLAVAVTDALLLIR